MGVAGDVTDWLSLGAGMQVLADLTRGASPRDGHPRAASFDRRSVDVTLQPTLSPFFGIHVRQPLGRDGGQLKIGLAFRGSSAMQFRLPVLVSEGEGLGLVIDVEQVVLWTPKQIAFGLSYGLDDPALTFALDLTYAMLWSQALDPSPRLRSTWPGVCWTRSASTTRSICRLRVHTHRPGLRRHADRAGRRRVRARRAGHAARRLHVPTHPGAAPDRLDGLPRQRRAHRRARRRRVASQGPLQGGALLSTSTSRCRARCYRGAASIGPTR